MPINQPLDRMRYEVKAGDTLSSISAQLGIPWQDLFSINKGVIGGDPNMIKPGMILATDPAAVEGTPGFGPSTMSLFKAGQ